MQLPINLESLKTQIWYLWGAWMRKEEQQQCAALIRWARIKGWFIFKIENEGKRAPWYAKEQGIVAGVSDYMMPIPKNGKAGLFLEMKAPGRKPTRKQEVFLELMRRNGYAAGWFDQWTDAAKFIERYLNNEV